MSGDWLPYLPYNGVTCRYNEIGTKGRNRQFFVRHLVEGLGRRLSRWFGAPRFSMEHGRIFMLPEEKGSRITPEQLDALRSEVPGLPGISSVSPGFLIPATPEDIEKKVMEIFPVLYQAFAAAVPEGERSYAMRVNRVDKEFPLRSADMERAFAERILSAHPDLHLDLKHAALCIEVDIRKGRAFISCERISGAGGLPTGSAGGVLAMLSGGFDSPVACFEMMRRGCNVDFITFHSSPYTPPETVTKVASLVRRMNTFQKRGRFVAVNLLPFQKAVRDFCQEKFRTVLYRRAMVRLSAVVARYFGDLALVTGDNLGQVASQTLVNMSVIQNASSMMILRPLLTFDKLDIM
ncbi:MAG: tRNA 4-thiouridine(8) synthase ThiI, partial [Victivallales bacterium]|nr:tRNA 4-thiouridine(8) synthase ThiI [Victivallales bacterium]